VSEVKRLVHLALEAAQEIQSHTNEIGWYANVAEYGGHATVVIQPHPDHDAVYSLRLKSSHTRNYDELTSDLLKSINMFPEGWPIICWWGGKITSGTVVSDSGATVVVDCDGKRVLGRQWVNSDVITLLKEAA
jgi:hypothetical protein